MAALTIVSQTVSGNWPAPNYGSYIRFNPISRSLALLCFDDSGKAGLYSGNLSDCKLEVTWRFILSLSDLVGPHNKANWWDLIDLTVLQDGVVVVLARNVKGYRLTTVSLQNTVTSTDLALTSQIECILPINGIDVCLLGETQAYRWRPGCPTIIEEMPAVPSEFAKGFCLRKTPLPHNRHVVTSGRSLSILDESSQPLMVCDFKAKEESEYVHVVPLIAVADCDCNVVVAEFTGDNTVQWFNIDLDTMTIEPFDIVKPNHKKFSDAIGITLGDDNSMFICCADGLYVAEVPWVAAGF